MWLATHATAWHPDFLAREKDLDRLRKAAESDPNATWERELFAALATTDERTRVALVNEQLTELDGRLQEWASVPRVCARVATSSAFLLAALVLRNGLADNDTVSSDLVQGLIFDGLTVIFFGFAGTAFCIVANRESRLATRARSQAADAVVERFDPVK